MSTLAVCRSIYTEEQFHKTYGSHKDLERPPLRLRDRLARSCTCSAHAFLHLLKRRVPILSWLPRYKLKKWLLGDLIAGLTVGIVHIPQGMAFALLTSVAPVHGLYTSFFPVVLYMLLGTGRHVSTGTFAVLSLMTGSVIDEHLAENPLERNLTSEEQSDIYAQRIGMAAAIAFLIGIIMAAISGHFAWSCAFRKSQHFTVELLSEKRLFLLLNVIGGVTAGLGSLLVAMFVLQLGFLSTYLSEPIVKAFTNAAAFHVTISQIQNMLGLPLPRFTGSFTIFRTLTSVVQSLPMTNVAELVISILCLIVLIPIKELNARFRTKLRTPIPGEIVMVLLATGVTFASSLDSRYNVQIVGSIPAGFPAPKLPSLKVIPKVVGDTIAITFVGYAVSVSLAMIYAEKHRYSIDPNQELLAHGISNIVSSLFTCFPSSATLATTNILESAGGHTQLSGFFTSGVVLIVLIWIGPLFNYLPKAVLACINVVSLRQMFLQFRELPELWKISKTDFSVWVVTWMAVVVLNVEMGLAVGVVFSMMTVVCRTQRAQCTVMGRAVSTEIYRPVEQNDKCYEIPGLKILSYNSPIYYGNRDIYKDAVSQIVGLTQEKIRKREKALLVLEQARKMNISVVVHGLMHIIIPLLWQQNSLYTGSSMQCRTGPPGNLEKSRWAKVSVGPYAARHVACLMAISYFYEHKEGHYYLIQDSGIANPVFHQDGCILKPEADMEIKSLIIDCTGVIFVDSAGARLFIQMCTDCQKAGMHLLLAGCNEKVLRTLQCSGIMDHLSAEQVFVTVHDAACYAEQNMASDSYLLGSVPPICF